MSLHNYPQQRSQRKSLVQLLITFTLIISVIASPVYQDDSVDRLNERDSLPGPLCPITVPMNLNLSGIAPDGQTWADYLNISSIPDPGAGNNTQNQTKRDISAARTYLPLTKRAGRLAPVDPKNLPASTDPRFQSQSDLWRLYYAQGKDNWNFIQHARRTPLPNRCVNLAPGWATGVFGGLGTTYRANDYPYNPENSQDNQYGTCAPTGLLTTLDNTFSPGASAKQKLCSASRTWGGAAMSIAPNTVEWSYFNYISTDGGYVDMYYSYGLPINNKRVPNSWADVTMKVWMDESDMKTSTITSLKYILRREVSVVAKKLFQFIWNQADQGGNPNPNYRQWTPKDVDFYALLASEEGQNAADLLINYSYLLATKTPDLGRVDKVKQIAQISAQNTGPGSYAIAIVFKDTDKPGGFASPF